MQLAPDKQFLLRTLLAQRAPAVRDSFCTGLEALDALAPRGEFSQHAVHELLSEPGATVPRTLALLLARAAQKSRGNAGAIVWSDPDHQLYPPAMLGDLQDLRRLILLRCSKAAEELWALAECLRCPGVCATIASVPRLTQLQARRLQLAAERGGGVGIFLRPYSKKVVPYAAATRWLVRAAPGDAQVQRWSVELLHGHGGQVGEVVLIEVSRETRLVRASAPVAHRSSASPPARAWA